jgi:hypothetical protein
MRNDLTREQVVSLLEYNRDTGEFRWKTGGTGTRKAGGIAGGLNNHGYRRIKINDRFYLCHRLAWLIVTGEWPEDQIDHMDGVRDNNAFSNLREVSGTINSQNRRRAASNNVTGFLGVSPCSDGRAGYRATIKADGKLIFIGEFATPEAAHEAYLAAKREMHVGCTI